jgi:hypothetical protein
MISMVIRGHDGFEGPEFRIDTRVARRSALRLGRARRALTSPPLSERLPEAGPILDALRAALASLPAADRRRFLHGPDVRGFLAEAEIWTRVWRLASKTAGGFGDRRALVELFERVSRTEHLGALVPFGRIDRWFPARSARFSILRLRESLAEIAAFLLGLRLAFPGPGRLGVTLEFRENQDLGRPRDRIDLGAVAGPAGPLAVVPAGPRAARWTDPPRRVGAILVGRTLGLKSAGRRETILPAAGSPLRHPDDPSPRRRMPSAGSLTGRSGPADSFRLVRRDTIPGTPILLGNIVDRRPRSPVVRRGAGGLGRRLARALRIVQIAWPQGHRAILARTWMVVPIREEGTVSYSLPSRPGVSYINDSGKPPLDLADDLLHETAHHRLHDLQEIVDLLRPGAATEEAQAFDSPWRGSKRPLHGLLHGTYTFLFRAELLQRVHRLALSRPKLLAPYLQRRNAAWIRRELRREISMLSAALRDLERAARDGLLTPAGERLVRSIRLEHARLRRPLRTSGRSTVSPRGRAAARGRDRKRAARRHPAR